MFYDNKLDRKTVSGFFKFRHWFKVIIIFFGTLMRPRQFQKVMAENMKPQSINRKHRFLGQQGIRLLGFFPNMRA